MSFGWDGRGRSRDRAAGRRADFEDLPEEPVIAAVSPASALARSALQSARAAGADKSARVIAALATCGISGSSADGTAVHPRLRLFVRP